MGLGQFQFLGWVDAGRAPAVGGAKEDPTSREFGTLHLFTVILRNHADTWQFGRYIGGGVHVG